MSARYFIETDGYEPQVWRQEGEDVPTVVTDPVEAFHAGMASADAAIARIKVVRDEGVGRRSPTYAGVSDYVLIGDLDTALEGGGEQS